jgi:hypothetical protein
MGLSFSNHSPSFGNTGTMDGGQLIPCPAKSPSGGISEDLYRTLNAYNFAKAQLAPKTAGLASRAILGMIGGMVAAVTLIEVFAKACN